MDDKTIKLLEAMTKMLIQVHDELKYDQTELRHEVDKVLTLIEWEQTELYNRVRKYENN